MLFSSMPSTNKRPNREKACCLSEAMNASACRFCQRLGGPLLLASLGGRLERRDRHLHAIASSNRIATRLGDLAKLARPVPCLTKFQLGNGAKPYITASTAHLNAEHP